MIFFTSEFHICYVKRSRSRFFGVPSVTRKGGSKVFDIRKLHRVQERELFVVRHFPCFFKERGYGRYLL